MCCWWMAGWSATETNELEQWPRWLSVWLPSISAAQLSTYFPPVVQRTGVGRKWISTKNCYKRRTRMLEEVILWAFVIFAEWWSFEGVYYKSTIIWLNRVVSKAERCGCSWAMWCLKFFRSYIFLSFLQDIYILTIFRLYLNYTNQNHYILTNFTLYLNCIMIFALILASPKSVDFERRVL